MALLKNRSSDYMKKILSGAKNEGLSLDKKSEELFIDIAQDSSVAKDMNVPYDSRDFYNLAKTAVYSYLLKKSLVLEKRFDMLAN